MRIFENIDIVVDLSINIYNSRFTVTNTLIRSGLIHDDSRPEEARATDSQW